MEETPPTNELIARLVAGLSPEGRAALVRLDELEAAQTPDVGADLGLVDLEALTAKDRGTIVRILALRARAYEAQAEEYQEGAAVAEQGVAVLERAHELERAAGREPDPTMTLAEALAVLERHGGTCPRFPTDRRYRAWSKSCRERSTRWALSAPARPTRRPYRPARG